MLEGLYWTADGSIDLDVILGPDRGTWRWTLFIALPDEATDEELADALAKGRAKVAPEIAADLRIETVAEGAVAQVLYLGPYADERPTIEALHAAIAAAGLRPRGRHHELYLGDPGRSAPAKLRTSSASRSSRPERGQVDRRRGLGPPVRRPRVLVAGDAELVALRVGQHRPAEVAEGALRDHATRPARPAGRPRRP